jgi:hypothetical protein
MVSAARQRSLIVPREHGAWGILLVPLFTGACLGLLAGGSPWSLVPLVAVALSLFWLRTPIESWMGTTPVRARSGPEIRLVRRTVLALTGVAAVAGIWLFWRGRNRDLWWLGCAAAAAFLLQTIARKRWRIARTAPQMIGAAGLTATAPAAYYVATGLWNATAWSLWAANLLFAMNQIHFVHLRIHAARAGSRGEKLASGHPFLVGQALLIVLLTGACTFHLFPWYGAIAFLPILYRGFAWFGVKPEPLAVRTLGKSELAYACLFGLVLVLGVAVGQPSPPVLP